MSQSESRRARRAAKTGQKRVQKKAIKLVTAARSGDEDAQRRIIEAAERKRVRTVQRRYRLLILRGLSALSAATGIGTGAIIWLNVINTGIDFFNWWAAGGCAAVIGGLAGAAKLWGRSRK